MDMAALALGNMRETVVENPLRKSGKEVEILRSKPVIGTSLKP
jgi:hypothetical protein